MGGCAFISVAPANVVNPTAAFMAKVRAIVGEIRSYAPYAASCIEGNGVQAMLTRALQTSLFTMTNNNRKIAVVGSLREAFQWLSPTTGVRISSWLEEASA